MAAKKKTKKKAAKKSSSKAGYDLAVAMLKRNPGVDYATVKAAADKKGISIYPIVYGRAQLALGMVKKKKGAKKPGRKPGRRGPGRPRKVAAGTGIDAIVSQIRETERERDQALATLAKIRDMIDAAL